jgi:hypothetical protein
VTDNLCRRLVRQVRNPEDRHKAHATHYTARDCTVKLERQVHSRQSLSSSAAAAAEAAAALLAVAPADAARAEAPGEVF